MANQRWRQVNQFIAFSGIGKQQSALGVWLDNAGIDTRDKCTIEEEDNVDRREERNCDNVDLVDMPIRTRFKRFRLTYPRVTPQIAARFAAYKEGVVTNPTGTPANEVQTLSRSGTVSGGTFPISLTIEGRTGVSRPIPFDATAAQIKTILEKPGTSLIKIAKPGDIVVAGDWTAGITLTFSKRLQRANLPLVVINNASIIGGGTVAVAATTNGENYFHEISRSPNGEKPLFSCATGDKNASVATRKYGDMICESLDFSISEETGETQMVVVIAGSYFPEKLDSFPVPPCINPKPIELQDIRLLINNNYETNDIVNHAVSLNDNVPMEAAFGFDDMDISVEPERGNQPAQSFTSELYGNDESPTYILAENERTQDPVEYVTHFGNPGNRFSIIADETKLMLQQQPTGFAGPLSQSTFRITGIPFGITDIPVRYEAYLDQSVPFLSV